jgi:hypothetical protein
MRRVEKSVRLIVARERLEHFRKHHGIGPHRASTLADVIWPDTKFINAQGAGAAASRILKKLGCKWIGNRRNWGWII